MGRRGTTACDKMILTMRDKIETTGIIIGSIAAISLSQINLLISTLLGAAGLILACLKIKHHVCRPKPGEADICAECPMKQYTKPDDD